VGPRLKPSREFATYYDMPASGGGKTFMLENVEPELFEAFFY